MVEIGYAARATICLEHPNRESDTRRFAHRDNWELGRGTRRVEFPVCAILAVRSAPNPALRLLDSLEAAKEVGIMPRSRE